MTLLTLLAASPPFFIGTCLLLGLLVGSFLNVVIYRVPLMLELQWRDQCAEFAAGDAAAGPRAAPAGNPAALTPGCAPGASPPTSTATPRAPFNLLRPRSACPACKAPISALQNIPVLSYLFLGGRCACCGAAIGLRYPLIEALTGVASAAVAWKFGFGYPALAALVLTWFLIALTFIDVDHQLLPDSLTLPLLWIGLLLSLWGPAGAELSRQGITTIPVDMHSSIVGAIAGYLSLWSVYHLFRLLTAKEGMGYGDFKLFAALGAWLGWKMLLPIILMAAVVGAIVGIGMIALRGRDKGLPIAFGPFLAASGWLVLMFGRELVTGYLGMFSVSP